jgi:hypothetical protein
MPDVELVATKDLSYGTRRLKAGDIFTVPASMARVLVGIGKAERPREPGKVEAPSARVVERAAAATPAKAESKPVGAVSTRAGKPKPSEPGRSTRRRTARKNTAKKG